MSVLASTETSLLQPTCTEEEIDFYCLLKTKIQKKEHFKNKQILRAKLYRYRFLFCLCNSIINRKF